MKLPIVERQQGKSCFHEGDKCSLSELRICCNHPLPCPPLPGRPHTPVPGDKPAAAPQQTAQAPKKGNSPDACSAPLDHKSMQGTGHPALSAEQDPSPRPCRNVLSQGSRGSAASPRLSRVPKNTRGSTASKNSLSLVRSLLAEQRLLDGISPLDSAIVASKRTQARQKKKTPSTTSP